jgi:hypothetical protein
MMGSVISPASNVPHQSGVRAAKQRYSWTMKRQNELENEEKNKGEQCQKLQIKYGFYTVVLALLAVLPG